jgi:hypothetical protein
MHSGTTFNPPQHPPASALAITLDAQPPALRSTRTRPRTAVRQGAAACRAVLRSCPVTAAAGVVTAEPSSVVERRRRCNPSEVCAASRRPPPSWPSRMSGHRPRRPSRCPHPLSAMRTDVRPTRRADVRCPGVRCPGDGVMRVSGQTRASGVRGRCSCAVRTALDPGTRRCGGTGHGGRSGFDVSPWSVSGLGVAAESGLAGKG